MMKLPRSIQDDKIDYKEDNMEDEAGRQKIKSRMKRVLGRPGNCQLKYINQSQLTDATSPYKSAI